MAYLLKYCSKLLHLSNQQKSNEMKTNGLFKMMAAILMTTLISMGNSSVFAQPSVKNYAAPDYSQGSAGEVNDTFVVGMVYDNIVNLEKCLREKICYPATAFEKEVEGSVRVFCRVGEDGKVKEAKIISSSDASLEKEVLDAVAKLTFMPVVENGFAKGYTLIIPVKFRII